MDKNKNKDSQIRNRFMKRNGRKSKRSDSFISLLQKNRKNSFTSHLS